MPYTKAARAKAKNTIKLADLQSDLGLSAVDFNRVLVEANVRLAEGQKNVDPQEAARVRSVVNEERRRADLQKQTVPLPSIVGVKELAAALELPVGRILSSLLKNGVMATLNDDLDYDTAAIIAHELGYRTAESVAALEKAVLTPEKLEEILKREDPKKQQPRPPVVAILGHVDHGKTTLLSSIRDTHVPQEAGGITQAISSYQVDYHGRRITFIDTPGHETFEFMRKRGASLADIAILVVAADDGVKPQTKEAVKHAREAEVPIVVAINKIDKPAANVDRVKKELAEQLDLQPEEWGGKTVVVPISALKKQGIDDLLEMVLLTADLNPPRAIEKRPALGSVVESRLDKNLGPLATVLVHTGTLAVGHAVAVGQAAGQVRRLTDWRGRSVREAGPSVPVTIVGLEGVPNAGEVMQVVDEREEARLKAASRRGRGVVKTLAKTDEEDTRQALAVVLKADSHGSLEALQQTITAMVPPDVRLSVIRADVGAVSDSDVLTAQAAGAIVYAFTTNIGGMAQKLASKAHVSIRRFNVIYQLTDDIRQEIERRLPVDIVRTELGTLKVLKVFFSIQKRKIVGGEITQGTAERGARAVILRAAAAGRREREEIGHGTVTELQREKKAVERAQMGDLIGITYEGAGKIKVGDVLRFFREEEVRRETRPASAADQAPRGR